MFVAVAGCSKPGWVAGAATGPVSPASANAPVSSGEATAEASGPRSRTFTEILVEDGNHRCEDLGEGIWRCVAPNDFTYNLAFPDETAVFEKSYARPWLTPCSTVKQLLSATETDSYTHICTDTLLYLQLTVPYSTPTVAAYTTFDELTSKDWANAPEVFKPNDQRSPGEIMVARISADGSTCSGREVDWACTRGGVEFALSYSQQEPRTISVTSTRERAFAKPCKKFKAAVADLKKPSFEVSCSDESQAFEFTTTFPFDYETDGAAMLREHVARVTKSVELLTSIGALR
ncbi:MAG: hypothetical protein ACKV2T_37060 [Kofleriaceae bacterium]